MSVSEKKKKVSSLDLNERFERKKKVSSSDLNECFGKKKCRV